MKLWLWKREWVAKHAERKANQLDFASIKRITVVKHAAMGDLVMTRPFLITLKNYFPNARITLSVASHYMAGIPHELVDQVHVVHSKKDGKGFLTRWKELRSLGEQDLLFDISAVSRTFWLSKLTKAKLKIGFKHKLAHRFIYDIAIDRTGYKFEAETFLDQLLVLGLKHKWPLEFGMQPGTSPISGKYVVYFPTASDNYKTWEFHRFAELIKELHSLYPEHKHVLLAGLADWERKLCDKVEALLDDKKNFLRVDGSDETFDIIAGASLLVSNDTGIRNLAIAYHTPTVGIYISTFPFNYAPRFGKHEIVFRTEGGQPEVKQVLDATVKVLGESEG